MQDVLSHHLGIVSWLASTDTDCLKTPNRKKRSALQYASANGKIEIASVLFESLISLDKISLISSPDNNGVTAFYWSCSKGYLEFSKWLLEIYKNYMSESDPLLHTIQDKNGYTPLMQAVLSHHLKTVSWLASIDPDCMKTRNKKKQSALHYAAAKDNIEMASVLLKSLSSSDKNSLISSPDNKGVTAFSWSYLKFYLEFSKSLLEDYKNCKSKSDPL